MKLSVWRYVFEDLYEVLQSGPKSRKWFFFFPSLMGHWSKGWEKKILNGVIGIWNSRLGVLQVYGHEIMGSNVQMYRLNGLYMLFSFSSFFWHCIEKKNNFIVICFILYVRRVVSICFLCTNKRKLYFLSDFFIVFYLSEEELKVFNIIGQMCTFFWEIYLHVGCTCNVLCYISKACIVIFSKDLQFAFWFMERKNIFAIYFYKIFWEIVPHNIEWALYSEKHSLMPLKFK